MLMPIWESNPVLKSKLDHCSLIHVLQESCCSKSGWQQQVYFPCPSCFIAIVWWDHTIYRKITINSNPTKRHCIESLQYSKRVSAGSLVKKVQLNVGCCNWHSALRTKPKMFCSPWVSHCRRNGEQLLVMKAACKLEIYVPLHRMPLLLCPATGKEYLWVLLTRTSLQTLISTLKPLKINSGTLYTYEMVGFHGC